jgi:membrane protein DedA with SNARE-associated domain
VGAARVVAFVRTVMPMAAGASRLPYVRFLPYELTGLAACVALYVGIGFAARQSWEAATRWFGIGGGVAFLALGAAAWWTVRRRVRRGGGGRALGGRMAPGAGEER